MTQKEDVELRIAEDALERANALKLLAQDLRDHVGDKLFGRRLANFKRFLDRLRDYAREDDREWRSIKPTHKDKNNAAASSRESD